MKTCPVHPQEPLSPDPETGATVCSECGFFFLPIVKAGMGLTYQQRKCLQFIISYQQETGGVSPSFDEIAEALGLAAKSSVHKLINGLEDRGRIRRYPHRNRAIEILRAS